MRQLVPWQARNLGRDAHCTGMAMKFLSTEGMKGVFEQCQNPWPSRRGCEDKAYEGMIGGQVHARPDELSATAMGKLGTYSMLSLRCSCGPSQ